MLIVSDEILSSAHITAEELSAEIAVYLYAKGKLSYGQACKLSGRDVLEFQELLYNNDVPVNYGVADLEDDFKSIHAVL